MLKHTVVFDLSSHIWLFIIPRDDLLFRKYDKIPGLWISFQRINRQKIDHIAPQDYTRTVELKWRKRRWTLRNRLWRRHAENLKLQ
ncbi:unnamed protein product [Cyprideis torosa]|uniref:Uncharacterized protein n=1 Tax=Cyprideis torosa TaxID=163714 RepID=A0A7R8WG96_9CRUS|nr:unnamed protein product [Cyprideis torosa]CAG0897922.1 unnamed protein product [Cyprideis torosa]